MRGDGAVPVPARRLWHDFLYDLMWREHGSAEQPLSTGSRQFEERDPELDGNMTGQGDRGRRTDGGGQSPGKASGRLADEVYDTLLAQLMSLRIEPGSRVTIDALARDLGVFQ